MKLKWSSLSKEGAHGVAVQDSILTFSCTEPAIIQSTEIQKVKVGMSFQIEKGYVLNISTCPRLYEQAGEVFPALIVLDHTHTGELMIPVRNNGRNPLNLMQGVVIAQAYVSKVEALEMEEFQADTPSTKMPRTKPQKKNTGPSFEIR